MTDINPFLKRLLLILLGLTLSAPASFASVKVYDLRNPETEITDQLSISQGGVVALQLSPTDQAWFNDKPVFIGAEGQAIVALHRDETEAVLRVVSEDGTELIKPFDVQLREYRIERIDGLPPAKVTAPRDPAITARIRAEARAIRKARQRLDDRQDFQSGFIWPVTGRISGVYGSQRILNGEPNPVKERDSLVVSAPFGGAGDHLPKLGHRVIRVELLDISLDPGLRRVFHKKVGAHQHVAMDFGLARAIASNGVDV